MRSAKELVAGLRALHTNNDDTRAFLREAADYIERTASPADGLPETTTAEDRAVNKTLAALASERTAHEQTKAALAAETKRADEEAAARREAEATRKIIEHQCGQAIIDRDNAEDRAEQAEAREATLRAALEKVHRSLDAEISMWRCACPHPCEDYLVHPGPCSTRTAEALRNIDVIARAALATTSTGEGS